MCDGDTRNLWKGLAAGAVGGLTAAWAMNYVGRLLGRPNLTGGNQPQADKPDQDQEDATMKTANAVSRAVTGRELTRHQKTLGSPMVHYGFGASMGALYGVLRELRPTAGLARGAPFGAVVWLGADEMALPLLGLSKAPPSYPLATHIQALAAHLVYGFTTDCVYRTMRRML